MYDTFKILEIVGELRMSKQIQLGLQGYGYQVLTADAPEEGLALAAQKKPDIIVLSLDVKGGMNGFDLCRRLREWSATPIIAFSIKNDKRTRIEAFNVGADDFISIPFDMEEVEAHIRARLRRGALEKSSSVDPQIQVDGLEIDLSKRRVMLNQQVIHLTPNEYKLLRLLAVNAGKTLTSDLLLDEIWDAHRSSSEHLLRVHISGLRKKLGEDAGSAHFIVTEPGIGYRFADVETKPIAKSPHMR